jgi:hypothetical protein
MKTFLHALLLPLAGCAGGGNPSPLFELDVFKNHEKRDINLQAVATVEYIPLETADSVLLDGTALARVAVSDSLIVTANRQDHAFFVFNRAGRLLHRFSRTGRGPGEYAWVDDFTVDFAAGELFVAGNDLVQVYTLAGEWRRSLPVPAGTRVETVLDFDGEHLLVHAPGAGWYFGEEVAGSIRPYYLLSKRDGSATPAGVTAPSFTGRDIVDIKRSGSEIASISIFLNRERATTRRNGTEFFISDFASDTIHALAPGVAPRPFIVKRPSTRGGAVPLLVSVEVKSGRYTLVSLVDKQPGFPARLLLLDHVTGETLVPRFLNDDLVPPREVTLDGLAELPRDHARQRLEPVELLERHARGETRGRLAAVAAGLEENDNPVLMLIKFKE